MPSETRTLPDRLQAAQREGMPALILTVDEQGFPHTAFTFAATVAADRVYFVLDDGSRTLANIARDPRASLQIIAPGNQVYLVKGTVRPGNARMKSSPVPSRRAELEVRSVKDQAWPEIVVAPLAYLYSEQARAVWEHSVPRIYAELRGDARD